MSKDKALHPEKGCTPENVVQSTTISGIGALGQLFGLAIKNEALKAEEELKRKAAKEKKDPNIAKALTEKKVSEHPRVLARISSLNQLRIKVWFRYLLAESATKNVDDFEKWLDLNGVPDNSLDNIEWSTYEKGTRTPSAKTLATVESVIKGSKAAYNLTALKKLKKKNLNFSNYPAAIAPTEDNLPVIEVLNGDLDVCERLLLEVMAEFKLGGINVSLKQQCEAIFKLVVDRTLMVDHQHDYLADGEVIYGGVAGMTAGGYFSIEEMMAKSTNVVGESYLRAIDPRPANFIKRHQGFYKIGIRKVVLVIIALSRFCRGNSDGDGKAIAYYLIEGITEKAVSDLFGDAVNEYVKNLDL